MDFEELYAKNVIRNIIGWNTSIDPTEGSYEAQATTSLEFSSSLREFIKNKPYHRVSAYYSNKVLPYNLDKEKLVKTQALWKKYLDLKKNQENADQDYFNKLNDVISLNKRITNHFNLEPTNQMYINDETLGTQEDVLDVIERMAEISQRFLKEKPQNKISKNKEFKLNDLTAYIDKIEGLGYRISNNNGSFMTSIDKDNSRIHIDGSQDDMFQVASSIYHECGHGLYQNRIVNKNTDIGKLGDAPSLSLHESSSILFEIALSGIDYSVRERVANLYRLGTDKVHYIIHIYIRLKIESMLFKDEIKAEDIPDIWDSMIEKYIGIRPANHWQGFLQDVHWNDGAFGYFQSYAIGFLNAVIMYQEIENKLTGNDYKDSVDIILPAIDAWYGGYNEKSYDILKYMHPDINESLLSYENFIFSRFNYLG